MLKVFLHLNKQNNFEHSEDTDASVTDQILHC